MQGGCYLKTYCSCPFAIILSCLCNCFVILLWLVTKQINLKLKKLPWRYVTQMDKLNRYTLRRDTLCVISKVAMLQNS